MSIIGGFHQLFSLGVILFSEFSRPLVNSMPNVACCFKLSPWTSGLFSPCQVSLTPSGESTFPPFEAIIIPNGNEARTPCNILYILFEVSTSNRVFVNICMREGAILSRKCAIDAFTFMGEGIFVEMLIMLWMLFNFFLFSQVLVALCLEWLNVTFLVGIFLEYLECDFRCCYRQYLRVGLRIVKYFCLCVYPLGRQLWLLVRLF